jgi:hypothetical protein
MPDAPKTTLWLTRVWLCASLALVVAFGPKWLWPVMVLAVGMYLLGDALRRRA